jgi:hypothetical protein
MQKLILSFLLIGTFLSYSGPSMAWGKRGHELTAEIAFHYLDEPTRLLVKKYLGKMSIQEASTWMDEERSNSYYNYMRTWHYLDVTKGQEFKPSTEHNIITVLNSAIAQLRKYETMKKSDVRYNLLLIFHLVGDLHQPLHVGYPEDRGGNDIQIRSSKFSDNLHSSWDTDMIDNAGITMDDCIKLADNYTPAEISEIKKISLMRWMNQSRSQLDAVYDFKNNFLTTNYVDNATVIIKKQLLLGGLRLASILQELFATKA